ncbi:MAG TPA: hypothetical protein VML19_09900 [Verrucomicrobiae bacterium]|nr:hypothetical protein [Verrucomicrobiae bacterium]
MRFAETLTPECSRYILLHYHIFKNGGSTIESILERQFPERFATLHGSSSETALDASDLLRFLSRHPKVCAVSSHHLRYPKPQNGQSVFFDCCFLRHPLARLQSSYRYFCRCGLDHPLAIWARAYTSREFMRRLIDEAPHQVCDVQVTQLANAGAFTRPPGEQDLERAGAIVREMALPGLVEMFDESLVVGEFFLRPAFPTLRMEHVPVNVSGDGDPPADSPEYWTNLWGKDLYQTLLRMNELDIELVARARREILRRLDLIPRVSEKLMDFRTRCRRLPASWPVAASAAAGA